ncbi:fructose-specific PTS transporter subunit EIIC [uncultured Nocardioides sp.]|uniref:PTS fructose transporter subunit IIABC n=1 Tax=uncultured Nocardioides sp. TaxID=198441 RepID=UPI002632DBFA|nr:fructose-specific PTS transporter subunit EIIC [uncultured Nocardioides sp.]
MADVITTDLVRLDAAYGADKLDVIRALAQVVGDAGRTSDVEQLTADAHAREATSPTGLKDGIAIPHCRTTAVSEPTLVFARLSPPVDFGAKDGGADICFLIAAPEGGGNAHLQLLTKLARSLVKPEFRAALREASTPDEVVATVMAVVEPERQPAGAAPAAGAASLDKGASSASGTPATGRRLVAVTACPTGIAHTYMAAEALEAAAAKAGVTIDVETQGSAGSTPLSPDTIAKADAVIFAVDVGVRDRGRFAGKPLLSSGVKGPIDDGDGMIAKALRLADDPNAPRVEGSGSDAAESKGSESFGGSVRRVLMTGVSYMIPFVAAGGLLIALGFLLAGYEIALGYADGRPSSVAQDIVLNSSFANLPNLADYELANNAAFTHGALLTYVGALLFVLGGAAFGFLVPALAGYIAYAIADRPGIAPGFVMGAVAGLTGTGFIGGIIGGVLAGLVAAWISRWKVPAWARGLMPVLVIPLLATLITGLIVIVVLGRPLTALTGALTDGLNSLGDNPGLAILLGVVLGLMMAFDMGGPLNKTAYAFATAGLGAAATATGDAPELKVMAAVMLAGMVPPLALALATVVRPKLFTVQEKENGKAAWAMGASFITEGAIPFAAADPLRVIPAIMLGSAVTGGLSQALDVTLRAPHGGIFVLFAVGNITGFIIALVAGTLVAAAAVVGLKSMASKPVVAPVA